MRRHVARTATALWAIALSISLAGCAGIHSSRSEASPSSPPTARATADVPAVAAPRPAFPSAAPGGTADASSLSAAQDRLAEAPVPPGAIRSGSRPAGVASVLAVGFWCRPMADATAYWTDPQMSVTEAVDYLKSHPPKGLTLAAVTGSNAAGDTNVEARLVEYAASADAQNGLVYEVTPIGPGAGIRADAFLVPPNAICATAPPGGALGNWGG